MSREDRVDAVDIPGSEWDTADFIVRANGTGGANGSYLSRVLRRGEQAFDNGFAKNVPTNPETITVPSALK